MKTMPSHDSSPLDVVQRSDTPVEPRTPVRTAASSMSSILSESTTIERGTFKSGLKTPAASGSLGSISSSSSTTTPNYYNSCLTVPMTFTPKGSSTGARNVKPRRGKKRKDSVLVLDDIEEADDALAAGSPKRKKRL